MKAEDILNPFIKGDLKRDYNKSARESSYVRISTALQAIRKGMKIAQNNKAETEPSTSTNNDSPKLPCCKCGKDAVKPSWFCNECFDKYIKF